MQRNKIEQKPTHIRCNILHNDHYMIFTKGSQVIMIKYIKRQDLLLFMEEIRL